MKGATYHTVIDLRTGEGFYVGTNGRHYTEQEFAAAVEGAKRGDADAKATLAAIQRPGRMSKAEAREAMKREMDDCPLCQEERARGEQICAGSDDEIMRWWNESLPQKRPQEPRPPNWWHGKRPKKAKRRGRR